MATRTDLPAIKACLFDMDGLLIDSEDKYTICTNEVLREYGRPDLPWRIKAQLQGRPGPAAGKILFDWAQLPIPREEYLAKVQASQKKHFLDCRPLPGVTSLLTTLWKKTDPPIHMALATSSHAGNFKIKTDHIQETFECFAQEHRVLGDDERIGKGRGKPAPDIYLLALKTVNDRLQREGKEKIKPEECLVFEDSVPGVESGRRAGMQVVWCPHPGLLNEYKGREERVLAGQMGEYKEVEKKNENIGVVSEDGGKVTSGAPGEIGDGCAILLNSLEDFPYEKFKIRIKKDSQL
ncbi:hypothetical protein DOTSEDRAFT_74124 [Dothistroma septosporum NZE10]|uniref:HAD-like protein n=1 Tax=Dothistroma septosporum (strain NZE10 / CBS 128990) TaxID=675120 RepID=N1PCY9_DOTSN|nr:hypothetical protein DOTSEDRAFT_74124 [Dothistroma septosporum NZE10]